MPCNWTRDRLLLLHKCLHVTVCFLICSWIVVPLMLLLEQQTILTKRRGVHRQAKRALGELRNFRAPVVWEWMRTPTHQRRSSAKAPSADITLW